MVLLGDEGDLAAQAHRRDEVGVDPADGGPPRRRREHAGEQEGEGALAGTGRADHRHAGAGRRRQVDAAQHVVALLVRVAQRPGDDLLTDGLVGRGGAGSTSWTPSTRDSDAEATCTSSIQARRVSTGPISCCA